MKCMCKWIIISNHCAVMYRIDQHYIAAPLYSLSFIVVMGKLPILLRVWKLHCLTFHCSGPWHHCYLYINLSAVETFCPSDGDSEQNNKISWLVMLALDLHPLPPLLPSQHTTPQTTHTHILYVLVRSHLMHKYTGNTTKIIIINGECHMFCQTQAANSVDFLDYLDCVSVRGLWGSHRLPAVVSLWTWTKVTSPEILLGKNSAAFVSRNMNSFLAVCLLVTHFGSCVTCPMTCQQFSLNWRCSC